MKEVRQKIEQLISSVRYGAGCTLAMYGGIFLTMDALVSGHAFDPDASDEDRQDIHSMFGKIIGKIIGPKAAGK